MPVTRHLSGVSGIHTKEGRPLGYSSLTPFLAIPDPAGAIDFYEAVFGARVVGQVEMTLDGRKVLVHAELDFGQGRLQLGVPNPALGLVPPPGEGQACYSLALYCRDVDAVVAKAAASGATIREPAADFVSGDRYASILDPYGIRWTVMTRTVDLSDEESQARVAAWASQADQGQAG
jgi:PhnB protein